MTWIAKSIAYRIVLLADEIQHNRYWPFQINLKICLLTEDMYESLAKSKEPKND